MINYAVLLIIVLIAVFHDTRSRKIPNTVTLPAMAAGLFIQTVTVGIAGLISGVQGVILGTGLFFIIYLIGAMGAGDAKLVGAVGAFTGPKGVLLVSLFTALAGGIYALLLLLFYRTRTKGTLKGVKNTFMIFALTKKWELGPEGDDKEAPKLCYGVAIAVGTAVYIALNLSREL